MYKRLVLAMSMALAAAVAAQAQSVLITGAEGATLRKLANSPTLVTVVLKGDGAPEDPNLNIIEVQSRYFSAVNPEGMKVTYAFASVAEIRVQGGMVEQPDYGFLSNRSLRADEQEIVNLAWNRIQNLHDNANRNQDLKIRTAAMLVMKGDDEALEYLNRLTETNDYAAQFDASLALFVAGYDIPKDLLKAGFESGQRSIRVKAAHLAGLTKHRDSVPYLNKLLRDRSAELSAPAAIALARIGAREIIPQLFVMISDINDKKGEAAREAFTILGGADIIEELKLRIDATEGLRRYRMTVALHDLGDPLGTKLISESLAHTPTLAPFAAKTLAAAGEWEGAQFLREKLDKREDPTEHNELNRVRNAGVLILGGDSDASAVLQEELHSDFRSVKVLVCDTITKIGQRKLMPLLRPGIGNVDAEVAFHASTSAISFASPDFRERLIKVGLAE